MRARTAPLASVHSRTFPAEMVSLGSRNSSRDGDRAAAKVFVDGRGRVRAQRREITMSEQLTRSPIRSDSASIARGVPARQPCDPVTTRLAHSWHSNGEVTF